MAANQDNESEMRKQLAELPGRNMKCDLMLEVGDRSFPARKEVLILRMEYFRGMFNAEMEEKNKVFIKLDPEIVDPAVFDEILDYVHTFNITLKTAKLESLYRAVDFFCFTELKTRIENFMKDNINMDNLPVFFDIAVKFNLKTQEEDCKQFILSNPFLAKRARRAVGYLDFTELTTLLAKQSSLELFENMFHSSVEWILHDEQSRSNRAFELLQMIPLGRLSFHFCKQVIAKNTIVMNDIKCLQLLYESAIDYRPIEELYVFGGKGYDVTQLSSMSTYDSSTRQWFEQTEMPEELSHFACVVVNQRIYVCGGYDGNYTHDELYVFDRNVSEWNELKVMKHARHGCSMTFLDGHLYVAGGCDYDDKELSVVERYSIQNDEWEEVSPMIHKRTGLELVQLDGFLYALGGQNETKVLKSVEKYNPRTDQWTALGKMNYPHVHFGSAVLNERIYVVGKNGFEEYNPEEDKWRIMAPPIEPALGRRLTVFDGKLLAVGGTDYRPKDEEGISTVEYYDFENGSWITSNDMDYARCFHGVAVITRTYTPQ